MNQPLVAGWYPDPFGRHEHRFWDGVRWTEHVGSRGQQAIDVAHGVPPMHGSVPPHSFAATQFSPPPAPASKKVQKQLRRLGISNTHDQGGGSLFTERVLVVNQKAKLFERRAEYEVFDHQGRKLGSVHEFGTSASLVRTVRSNSTKRLQIVDALGQPLLTLTRPATVYKSRVTVTGRNGEHVGLIVQESLGVMASVLGGRFNVRFRMEADGVTLGTINAEDWRAWDFNIQDSTGSEIGRITKTWAGFGKENFTKADNYVVEIHRDLQGALSELVVSAALVVDTVLKQSSDTGRKPR